jgi:4-diphosphocytidyl-2-C-methyl-D-erythritol kinase
VADGGLVERAPAKVNLDLLIGGRRPDGYHELDSLVVFAGAHDLLTLERAGELSLSVDGATAGSVPAGAENLVLRAAEALAREAGVPPAATLQLTKALPVAAGLGGGSSDAAATLRGLNRLWHTNLAPERLRAVGLSIGADLPVCVFGRAARMRGIGDRVDPVRSLPDLPMLLVNPRQPLATGPVFKALQMREPMARAPLPTRPSVVELAIYLAESRNDLEPPAISLLPAIGEVLAVLRALPGCLIARMSGSGPSCWALFATSQELEAAGQSVRTAHPGWWQWAGVVPGEP